ncbi:hypothetical protein [Streptosporangium sp. CA-115845]|uniref:hypothetical protein n=1 Tax=Streptosporangium sp. CA-115845 TaxID=3240071 RepID=UPI003D9431B6
MTSDGIDSSDMYRSALVNAVAAVDAYVHGVIIDFGVDIILGRRPAGSKGKLGLPVGAIADILTATSAIEQELRARTHVTERLSHETFQKPDDIGNAFALVGLPKLWAAIFGQQAGVEKLALGLIVARRNVIVHSCDVDPALPTTVNGIIDQDAIDALATVERIILEIDRYVSSAV